MKFYSKAAMERVMKASEVILGAMAKRITRSRRKLLHQAKVRSIFQRRRYRRSLRPSWYDFSRLFRRYGTIRSRPRRRSRGRAGFRV